MNRIFFILVSALLLLSKAQAQPLGEGLYKTQCASCHGPKGQGTKRFPRALEGDRSVAQLADQIAKTMPESAPGSLKPNEASAVAAYIHETFYSSVARERNRPARIELSRLTVRQYRQSVADLIGSFRAPLSWPNERGLVGEYFSGRRMARNARVLERTDPVVNFDFGTTTPVPDKMPGDDFSLRWNGSLLAPETGSYEFVVRTEFAARLWVNDLRKALVDAWVKSGNETEYRASIFLVGGRPYPIRLEFTKAKQGVDDSNKQKVKPPAKKASLALLWKRPRGAVEVIPSRQLTPSQVAESFISTVPFPPDDRSYGWERGTAVSRAWDEATTEGALEAADYILGHLPELSGVAEDAKDRLPRLRTFGKQFAERAFRRPLSEVEVNSLLDRSFTSDRPPEAGLKRVILTVLKSPRFLYREVGGAPEGFETAARLAFLLWDSLPDPVLREAAAKGQLFTREHLAAQARRMISDPRAKAKLRHFLLTWSGAEHDLDVGKDAKTYPGFDTALIADLRTSLELFVEEVLWSEASDFRLLLSTEELYLNGRLAKFYGADMPEGAPFTRVRLRSEPRAGILTHPYLMTSFAHSHESSPIHRGVFLARGVLGLSLRPPPEAVAPLAPSLHPSLTTRERVVLQTRPNACVVCHGVINPLGFTLENYDAVGRFRTQDNGKPVDATGSYRERNGKEKSLSGPRALAAYLTGSEEVHEAFVEQLFHHLVQQPVRAFGPQTLDELRQGFAQKNFSIRDLVLEIAVRGAIHPQRPAAARGP